ncbi:MAG: geranylgeranylglycerol-phosphate geranylgeranyltransferase [Sulfolobales archaeon]
MHNIWGKLVQWIKLVRIHNLLIVLIGLLISVRASMIPHLEDLRYNNYAELIEIVLIIAPPALLAASGGYIRNDYFDLESDRISKPWRPLARGVIKPELADRVALAMYILAPLYSLLVIGWITAIFTLLNVILIDLYNSNLKRKGLAGNIVVSLATANVFIYGALSYSEKYIGRIEISIYALIPFLFAFLLTLTREIIKGIEDLEGDTRISAGTLALIYGFKKASAIALVIGVIIGLILVIPLYLIFSYQYLVLAILTVALAIYSSYYILGSVNTSEAINRARRARSLTKISLFIGTIAFLTWLFT